MSNRKNDGQKQQLKATLGAMLKMHADRQASARLVRIAEGLTRARQLGQQCFEKPEATVDDPLWGNDQLTSEG